MLCKYRILEGITSSFILNHSNGTGFNFGSTTFCCHSGTVLDSFLGAGRNSFNNPGTSSAWPTKLF